MCAKLPKCTSLHALQMIIDRFTALAVIVLKMEATQVHKGYFYISGSISLSIYFKCALKHPGVQVYMPKSFHRKWTRQKYKKLFRQ